MSETNKEFIKTTCPRDCYDACGITVVRENGEITKVMGDKDHHRTHGALCGKCSIAYNGIWLNKECRLKKPLKRINSKGLAPEFIETTWDEALNSIAKKLKSTIQSHGPKSIIHTHYTGTCSMIAGNVPNRFFNKIGATEIDPDTVCNKAGHEALRLTFGSSISGFDPRTASQTNCLIVWGANPSASAPHMHQYWLPEVKQHAKLIVIDPIKHNTAKLADLHLQLRPGTDAALAFGILNILIRDELINEKFIADNTLGWPDIQHEILESTPEKVSAITNVAIADIELAAKWYGEGLSMLWMGQGVQRQATGGNITRAIALLPIATGNIGKPGTGLLYMNSFPARGIDTDWLNGTALHKSEAHSVSHMDLVKLLRDESKSQVLFTWNNNIAASSPQQSQLRNALSRANLFHIALDIFPTDTTNFADYVLPAASFLEFDDLLLSYFDYTVSAQVKVAEPLGDSLPNQEIFRRLSKSMGFDDAALIESDESMIENMLGQLKMSISFNSLAKIGTTFWQLEPVIHFADKVYDTPSGKIEISSETWVAAGTSKAPSAQADSKTTLGKFRILSPADSWLMNSSYGNDKKIIRQLGQQTAWISQRSMDENNLKSGDMVLLKNATGELKLRVDISEDVPEQVILLPKGRWPSIDKASANVNILNPGEKCDLAESCAVHNIEVSIEHL